MRILIKSHDGEVLREVQAKWSEIASYDAISIPDRRCGNHELAVHGVNTSDDGHSIVGEAACVHCDERVGMILVERDTVFGAEEDIAVLRGRPRVYG